MVCSASLNRPWHRDVFLFVLSLSVCLSVCLKLLSYCLSICLWWTIYRPHGSFYSRRILTETETDSECFSVTGLSPLSVCLFVCLSVLGVKHQLTYLLKYLITVCLPVYLSACLSACLSVHFQQSSRSCCFSCTWQSLLSVCHWVDTVQNTRAPAPVRQATDVTTVDAATDLTARYNNTPTRHARNASWNPPGLHLIA